MSFMGGGAECSTAGNPLSQFQKHVQDDKTLQQDRLVGRGPAGHLNGFRTQSPSAPQDEVREFLMMTLAQIFNVVFNSASPRRSMVFSVPRQVSNQKCLCSVRLPI
jgi:hypothetical protein